MKSITKKLALPAALGLLVSLALLYATLAPAQTQWPFAPPTTPMAQRNAMNLVVNQVNWFQSATRTASSYTGGGYGQLMQQFQAVRDQWAGFKSTLTPQQLTSGANQVAEFDSGLDIIQEAFGDYEAAVANGQSNASAFSNMCQVLYEAMGVWGQEFKQDCRQLRVGWYSQRCRRVTALDMNWCVGGGCHAFRSMLWPEAARAREQQQPQPAYFETSWLAAQVKELCPQPGVFRCRKGRPESGLHQAPNPCQGWQPVAGGRPGGADHRVNADKASGTQKGCQNCCQPVFDLTRTGADFTSEHAVLASLQDARISSPRVRGSYPLLPRNDPRLPAANPAGLEWSESNGKTSRKPAPACTNPSLMQPWPELGGANCGSTREGK